MDGGDDLHRMRQANIASRPFPRIASVPLLARARSGMAVPLRDDWTAAMSGNDPEYAQPWVRLPGESPKPSPVPCPMCGSYAHAPNACLEPDFDWSVFRPEDDAPPEPRWVPCAERDLRDGDRVRQICEGTWHHRWGVTDPSRQLQQPEVVTYERWTP